jgi:hypothetical protein
MVRVELPLVAVIVTEEEAVAVQLNATVCPAVTAVGVADNETVGTTGGVCVVPLPQAVKAKSQKHASAKVSLRKTSAFIQLTPLSVLSATTSGT